MNQTGVHAALNPLVNYDAAVAGIGRDYTREELIAAYFDGLRTWRPDDCWGLTMQAAARGTLIKIEAV